MTTTEHAPPGGTAPAGGRHRRTRTGRGRRRRGVPPGSSPCRSALLFLTFTVWPVVQSLFMSFTDTRSRDLRDPFAVNIIGLDNYIKALSPTRPSCRRRATRAYFVIVGVPLTLVMALAAAVALDRGITRLRSVFRLGFYMPGHHLHRRRRGRVAVPAPATSTA